MNTVIHNGLAFFTKPDIKEDAMQFPIKWHKICLQNSEISLEDKKKELTRLQNQIDRDAKAIAFYRYQIDCAERSEECGFDADKYKVSRK